MVIVTPSIVDPLSDATPPTPPNLPVPMLDSKQFDKKTVKQEPAAQQPATGSPK
jgi:hypothetical protein